jgi:hypothetical protein
MQKIRRVLLGLMILLLVPSSFGQASGAVLNATVTLTSAQLQQLHSSPVSVVAAPGVGQFINVLSFAVQYKAGSAPYVLAGGGNFAIAPKFVNASAVPAVGLINQSTNGVAMSGEYPQATVSQSALENKPMTVQNDTGTEWTGGDGTVTVTVYYTVIALQ